MELLKNKCAQAWRYLTRAHSREENLLLMLIMLLCGMLLGVLLGPDRVRLLGSCNGNGNICGNDPVFPGEK